MKHSLLVSILALSLSAGGLACSGTTHESPTAQTQAGVSLAPVAQAAQGPVVRTWGKALGEVPLRPAQRTELEAMAAQADARHMKVHAAAKDVAVAFADQIEKGQIDRAALKPKIDLAVAAAEASQPDDRAAFQRMHDLLDADQRVKFADTLHAQRKDMHASHANGVEGAVPGGPGDFMTMAAAIMSLTPEQVAKIGTILRDARQEHMKAHEGEHRKWDHHERGKMMESFKADAFNIDQAMPKRDIKDKVEKGQARFFDVAEKILPILTPDQRALAAAKIREKANTNPAELLHH